MRINNNLMAMNAHRQLGVTNTAAGKTLEKLSSGYRINRAGDDAAGLAISEKMRGQIRGLSMASKNSQDAISLIQTAEGGLNETHAILQRMRELAIQSASDTNVEVDRTAIQDEMDQLIAELDRISNTIEFNTQKLLDGSFDGTFQIGANEGQTITLAIGKMNTASLGLISTNSIENGETKQAENNEEALLADGIYTLDGTTLVDTKGNTVATFDAETNTISVGSDAVITLKKAALADGAQITISDNGANYAVKNTFADDAEGINALAPGEYKVSGDNIIKDGILVGKVTKDESDNITGISIDGPEGSTAILAADLGFQSDKLADGVSFTINGSDVSTRSAASGSISAIDKAIETVSAERSKLGAYQNRLEHTIKNLDTSAENLQAAESRIRDVDMAKEMMEFTKNNILQQAATAMLAQANQAPSSVLQLLR